MAETPKTKSENGWNLYSKRISPIADGPKPWRETPYPIPTLRPWRNRPLRSSGVLFRAGMCSGCKTLFTPATIALDTTEINVDGVMRPLSPGMAVSVEIKTGTRRIIDYFWSPVAQVASEAMQER
ncbi:hypothetical protein P3T33_005269 [Rhizobium sp. AN67]|nr:hypothetical protein [Rhizobium sp. AN67]